MATAPNNNEIRHHNCQVDLLDLEIPERDLFDMVRNATAADILDIINIDPVQMIPLIWSPLACDCGNAPEIAPCPFCGMEPDIEPFPPWDVLVSLGEALEPQPEKPMFSNDSSTREDRLVVLAKRFSWQVDLWHPDDAVNIDPVELDYEMIRYLFTRKWWRKAGRPDVGHAGEPQKNGDPVAGPVTTRVKEAI